MFTSTMVHRCLTEDINIFVWSFIRIYFDNKVHITGMLNCYKSVLTKLNQGKPWFIWEGNTMFSFNFIYFFFNLKHISTLFETQNNIWATFGNTMIKIPLKFSFWFEFCTKRWIPVFRCEVPPSILNTPSPHLLNRQGWPSIAPSIPLWQGQPTNICYKKVTSSLQTQP